MGNTILQHLVKAKSGLMLLEDFESTNFMGDQGWLLNNGVPTTTTSIFFSGLRSLIMDLTYPQIQKAFSTPYQWAAGEFFDDASQTVTLFKPFMQFISVAAAAIWGLGVDNSVSTGFYTKIVNGVSSASTVARTNGWHKWEILYDGATVILKVDGTTVSTTAIAGLNFTILKVGLLAFSGATAFGYFDLIQVTSSSILTFKNLPSIGGALGSSGTLYNSAETVLAGPTQTTGTYTVDVTTLVTQQPFVGSFSATKTNGVRPLFRSPSLTFCAGDVWVYNNFDLGRRVASFSNSRPENRSDMESTGGVNQSLSYYSRDIAGLMLTDLTDDQKDELKRWWGFAKDGGIFSAAVDDSDVYLGKVSADTGTNPTTFTVNSTVGANRNARLMLTRLNGQTFEVAEVLSQTPTVFTIKKGLLENYQSGDQVRSVYYWPFVISTDMSFTPLLTNPKLKRWSVTINFKEAL